MTEFEKLMGDYEEAREKADKASRRAYWFTTVALWINLMNVGFQIGLIIGRHAH